MSWRKMILEEMAVVGEKWEDVVSCTLDDNGLDLEFDPGFGLVEGWPFTLWTNNRVYFPEATYHVGG